MFSLFNIFRMVAFLEGLSYILLLFIATPIKYLADNPQYVKMLGMPHGLLFMLYIILAFMLKQENNWFKSNFKMVILASIIPFGTFHLDHKYLRKNNA
jgi:integral membrane protein